MAAIAQNSVEQQRPTRIGAGVPGRGIDLGDGRDDAEAEIGGSRSMGMRSKPSLWPKAFKNHLVGIGCGALALGLRVRTVQVSSGQPNTLRAMQRRRRGRSCTR